MKIKQLSIELLSLLRILDLPLRFNFKKQSKNKMKLAVVGATGLVGSEILEVLEEHQALLAAIEAGDPTAARSAAARHMHNAAARIGQADPAFWAQDGGRYAQALIQARR